MGSAVQEALDIMGTTWSAPKLRPGQGLTNPLFALSVISVAYLCT